MNGSDVAMDGSDVSVIISTVDLCKSTCKSIETIVRLLRLIYGGSEVTDCNVDYDALRS